MKIHKNKVHIRKTSLADNHTLLFLHRIAREDIWKKHIWNISDRAAIWTDLRLWHDYLERDFGTSLIYIAHYGSNELGLLGMLNLSEAIGCANIIAWIDKSVRCGALLMRWYVQFLLEAQNAGICHFYAKIKKKNDISLKAAIRFGFTECKIIPAHLNKNDECTEACCVTRSTFFNSFEVKYIQRFLG